MIKRYIDKLVINYDNNYPDEAILNVCRENGRNSIEKYTLIHQFVGEEARAIYDSLFYGLPKTKGGGTDD
jgi:hypothetical protein